MQCLWKHFVYFHFKGMSNPDETTLIFVQITCYGISVSNNFPPGCVGMLEWFCITHLITFTQLITFKAIANLFRMSHI